MSVKIALKLLPVSTASLNFSIRTKRRAACCILFEINIDFGTANFQNTNKVNYTLVFHTLLSNYKVYLLLCHYFCRSFYEL